MSSTKIIRVGSRKSKLALIQTNNVIEKLKRIHPELQFEVVKMTTVGDRILDSALSKIGEKSLFTRELEESLKNESVDFVVHSLKDLPTVLPEGLVIGCVIKRDDPYDAVVMHPKHAGKQLDDLQKGSVIGTSSLRRCAQIRRKYPELEIKDIRGNLNTRFKKLDEADDYDAIILAVAGLDRMGWAERMSQKLSADVCMYAVSQGAVAVECRERDSFMLDALSPLHHQETALKCVLERAYLRRLEGGCTVPVSVFTEIKDDTMSIRGGVYSTDGKVAVEDSLTVSLKSSQNNKEQEGAKSSGIFCSIVSGKGDNSLHFVEAEKLGIDLANKMVSQGADEVLRVAKRKAREAIEEEAERKRLKRMEKTSEQLS